ncbi:MAG: deoxyguanosinetriphosphate triphosphohydrolase [Deferribacteres bacterium]|nr:deoxyguanosinetriphosphate triphosphohydrolase [Deferribacteres bacterium]
MKSIRREWEEWEQQFLHPKAVKSAESRGRTKEEPECSIRTVFQRDRDRIIHSKSFRRLKHKTQVFLAPTGDHYRTRLTHTLEVSQIARTISRALRLNEDLTEAIALGHDLGHTPFGHAGEEVLNSLLKDGFSHAEQSLRVVDMLEKDGRGLNLTYEVRDGILKHSKGLGKVIAEGKERPETLEGEVVRIADIIAYVNHDIDDALRAGILKLSDIPGDCLSFFGESHAERINRMVTDVIEETKRIEYERVTMSQEGLRLLYKLRNFLYKKVYSNPAIHREFEKAYKILKELFIFFCEHPERIRSSWTIPSDSPERRAADFISGMTDRYALELYRLIFLPRPWTIKEMEGGWI